MTVTTQHYKELAKLYLELYDPTTGYVKVSPDRHIELRAEIGRLTAEIWQERKRQGWVK
jgi:hypothetical protein